MLDNKKIIVVTPAGRKRYLEILLKYILKERDVIDQYVLWVNTKNKEDLEYIEEIRTKHPDFIILDNRFKDTPECGASSNIHRYFDECQSKNTVYIRLDDDIVWLQDNFIKNLAKYRIDNPKPFLIYGTILNNSIVDYVMQKFGMYSELGDFAYDCVESIAYKDPSVCEQKHLYLLENYISKLKAIPSFFISWNLNGYERTSINCISWLGESFAKFEGKVHPNEEVWLSTDYPRGEKTPNVIFGGAYCVHYAFHPQRDHMDRTNLLKQYKKISEYSDISLKSIDLSKINWNKISDISKILIYQTLTDNNDYNILSNK